jgi:hypothetical protein
MAAGRYNFIRVFCLQLLNWYDLAWELLLFASMFVAPWMILQMASTSLYIVCWSRGTCRSLGGSGANKWGQAKGMMEIVVLFLSYLD